MGACGCGDFYASFRFPGPAGIEYAMQVYPGCRDCATPAGVIIHRFTLDTAAQWGVHALPEMPFHVHGKDGSVDGDIAIAIIDPVILKAALAKFAREVPAGEYDHEGLVEDAMDEVFLPSVRKTNDEWMENTGERMREEKKAKKKTVKP